jgi:hypothetical protein
MAAPGGGRAQGETGDATEGSASAPAPQVLRFLRERLAAAILNGNDDTASRLIAELYYALNGELAR